MAWESSAWNLEFVRGDGSLPRHGKKTSARQALRKEDIDSGQSQGKAKSGQGGTSWPRPCPPGLLALPLEAWALVSFRVSITFKKAEHALLLPRGQWTIALFLKNRAGWWRRGGNKSGQASLGRPQGSNRHLRLTQKGILRSPFLRSRPQSMAPVKYIL